MDKKELLEKITLKKEFSKLPKKDVELAFEKFDKPQNAEYQKIKLTRNLLRQIYSSFSSRKLLDPKEQEVEWVLKKHKSTRERLPYYEEVYKKILSKNKTATVFDLGAGVNGYSYGFFEKLGYKIKYIGIEAVGQLVDLMNVFFKREKLNAKAVHLSLFELEKVKQIIKKEKKPKIVFLFKTVDSLEVLERDYSKKLISEICPLVDVFAVSFATKSIGKRTKFRAKRTWLLSFIQNNFNILDDFEFSGERYLVFTK